MSINSCQGPPLGQGVKDARQCAWTPMPLPGRSRAPQPLFPISLIHLMHKFDMEAFLTQWTPNSSCYYPAQQSLLKSCVQFGARYILPEQAPLLFLNFVYT